MKNNNLNLKIIKNEPLANHTTFQIGGAAKYFAETRNKKELISIREWAKKKKLPCFVLGGGSNILVSDRGFDGLVIKNKLNNIKIVAYSGKFPRRFSEKKIKNVFIEAESGVLTNRLVRYSIEEELEGLEEFLGLPGTIGGGINVNAHWQNKFISDWVVEKKYLENDDNILTAAIFKLKKADKKILWKKAMEAVHYRQKTQPLKFSSAGCIFKNISYADALRLSTPRYTLSAGFLIESCGLKGKKAGFAQISPMHANFIINLGGAMAKDVLELITLIKKAVKNKFGVKLEEEIKFVGNFNNRAI